MRALAVTTAVFAVSLSSRLAAQGTGCAETKYPEPLPTPNALVDSAHAIGDLAAFADPAKPMVFSVSFAAGDSVAHVRALENQDAAAAVTLANYVRHAHPREFWAFRVRLAGGGTPALTIERSKYCPPVSPAGQSHRADITGTVMSVEGMPMAPPLPPPPLVPGANTDPVIQVEAVIAPDGRVVEAHVLRSSGHLDKDKQSVKDIQRQKFEPARLDGQRIQGVYRSGGESPRP